MHPLSRASALSQQIPAVFPKVQAIIKANGGADAFPPAKTPKRRKYGTFSSGSGIASGKALG